jgi:cytochrome c
MNDPLFGNKVAGALLAAGLLFFGLPQLANAILGGGGHHGSHGELKLAYPIEIEMGSGVVEGGGAAEVDLGTMLAAADPAAGKKQTSFCVSCHSFVAGGPKMQGPNLHGVVGRPVASLAEFSYSAALKELGGVWTYERLDEYVKSPAKFAPGNAMSFAGIPKPKPRAELLAYLSTLSANPPPFPAPVAPPAEVAAEPAAPLPETAGAPAETPAPATEEPG